MNSKLTSLMFITLLGGSPLIVNCDEGGDSRQSARQQATTASCDSYARCEAIGSGKKYATLDDCQVKNEAYWNDAWPVAECDNKINSANLEICLGAIRSVECGNGLDLLNVIVNKCPKEKVCGSIATKDASVDK